MPDELGKAARELADAVAATPYWRTRLEDHIRTEVQKRLDARVEWWATYNAVVTGLLASRSDLSRAEIRDIATNFATATHGALPTGTK